MKLNYFSLEYKALFRLDFFPKKYTKQMLSWSDFKILGNICSGQSFSSVRCHLAWSPTLFQGNAAV